MCSGWIRWLDPANGNQVSTFATGLVNPVDLKVSADGALYYLDRGLGAVYRVGTDPEPELGLVVDGSNITLKWPTDAVGWAPITSETLAPDDWQPVPLTGVTVAQGVATLTLPEGQRRFYGLGGSPSSLDDPRYRHASRQYDLHCHLPTEGPTRKTLYDLSGSNARSNSWTFFRRRRWRSSLLNLASRNSVTTVSARALPITREPSTSTLMSSCSTP